jgi:hypothetical protein
MIRVWKDGGGRGGLGLEVERWPGIVREVGGEPVGVKDMTQEERKVSRFLTHRLRDGCLLHTYFFMMLLSNSCLPRGSS